MLTMLREALDIASLLTVFLYAPFAKTWKRATAWCFLVSLAGILCSLLIVHVDPVSSGELLGGTFALLVICPVVGLVVRLVKRGIFRITRLDEVEVRLRVAVGKRLGKRSDGVGSMDGNSLPPP